MEKKVCIAYIPMLRCTYFSDQVVDGGLVPIGDAYKLQDTIHANHVNMVKFSDLKTTKFCMRSRCFKVLLLENQLENVLRFWHLWSLFIPHNLPEVSHGCLLPFSDTPCFPPRVLSFGPLRISTSPSTSQIQAVVGLPQPKGLQHHSLVYQ